LARVRRDRLRSKTIRRHRELLVCLCLLLSECLRIEFLVTTETRTLTRNVPESMLDVHLLLYLSLTCIWIQVDTVLREVRLFVRHLIHLTFDSPPTRQRCPVLLRLGSRQLTHRSEFRLQETLELPSASFSVEVFQRLLLFFCQCHVTPGAWNARGGMQPQ